MSTTSRPTDPIAALSPAQTRRRQAKTAYILRKSGLGEGAFGQVFIAQAEDGREAAAKLVAKVPGAQRELLFVELGDVRNIVPIIDSGETEDHWVLIMPMSERSLRQELQAASALPVGAALVVLTDIADALAGIDGRVVHRDLKPDNVLLLHGVWSGRLRHLSICRGNDRA